MTISTAELMNQRGAPSAFNKHTPLGTTVTGVVRTADVQQCRDFKSKEPEFWDDGKPKQQMRVVIGTQERNPNDPHDNGDRAIYIKSWGENWRQFLQACDAVGLKDITPGCALTVRYTSDRPNDAGNDEKMYSYHVAAAPGPTGQLMHNSAPPAPPAQQAYAPHPAPAPAPAPQQWGAPPAAPPAAPQPQLGAPPSPPAQQTYAPPPPPEFPQPPAPINPQDPYSPSTADTAAAYQAWQNTQPPAPNQ